MEKRPILRLVTSDVPPPRQPRPLRDYLLVVGLAILGLVALVILVQSLPPPYGQLVAVEAIMILFGLYFSSTCPDVWLSRAIVAFAAMIGGLLMTTAASNLAAWVIVGVAGTVGTFAAAKSLRDE